MPITFLTAEWRKLIMAQYAVAPETLEAYLPPGLELDLFRGECFVSLVGFLFDKVRVKGVAFPFHTRFEEVNLRFYVRRREADGTSKRGVVFVGEFVPRMAITTIARTLYEEPYSTMPMRRAIVASSDGLDVRYEWKRGGRWNFVSAKGVAEAVPIEAGSVEEFITEHYFGYTRRTRGAGAKSTSEYAVSHPRWMCYPVREFTVEADFKELYGPAFAGIDVKRPSSVLLAEGSVVSVSGGVRLHLSDGQKTG